VPLLRYWNLFSLEGLPPQADQARERLAAHLAKTDRLASRFEAKRMRAAQAQERASESAPPTMSRLMRGT
jgi:acyl-[acyl-carrier protein] desaturase